MTCCPAHLNPFRVAKIDALAYRPQGLTWDEMMAQLEAMAWRGAIVGPHGSGKTTLIQSLIPRLTERGFSVHAARLTEATSRLDTEWWTPLRRAAGPTIIIVDGAERLGAIAWLKLCYCTRLAAGLVITLHEPARLPTWVTTRTDHALFRELVDELRPQAMFDTADIFARSSGNMRTALRDCYEAMWRESNV